MKPVVISAPGALPSEIDLTHALFQAGLALFHLRKPAFGESDLREYLDSFSKEERGRMVLHHHHPLCAEYGLRGVHGTAIDTEPEEPFQRSRSCHSLDELSQIKKGTSYVFLSPVFDSISKPGYLSAFEFQAVKAALQMYRQTEHSACVIALGGINSNNAATAREMGFDGVAVLGSVWQSDDPLRAYREIQAVWS